MITPYKTSQVSKKDQVENMFNTIAPRYDFLNHVLSMGIDKGWRRKAINLLRKDNPRLILDVATGTADFAIAANQLRPDNIEGIDIAEKMLEAGRVKVRQKGLDKVIRLTQADSEKIPFGDNTFDAITVGFGVRNFEHLEIGLKEMYRVLKPGGTALVLEFSAPTSFPVKQLYQFYFHNVLPVIGKLVSKDNSAYHYLPESVAAFPSGNDFLQLYRNAGFVETEQIRLTFGIASIYIGKKIRH